MRHRLAARPAVWHERRMPLQMDYHSITQVFERFRAHAPDPKSELYHTNAFTLVVAVALSAQATEVGVNKATRRLFEIAPTPQAMTMVPS